MTLRDMERPPNPTGNDSLIYAIIDGTGASAKTRKELGEVGLVANLRRLEKLRRRRIILGMNIFRYVRPSRRMKES